MGIVGNYIVDEVVEAGTEFAISNMLRGIGIPIAPVKLKHKGCVQDY